MKGLVGKVLGWAVPVLKEESHEYYKKNVMEDKYVRQHLEEHPEDAGALESIIDNNRTHYKNMITAAGMVDTLDKWGAAFALFGDIFGGAGVGEDALELIYKIPYAIYYLAKTKDYGALIGWGIHEVLSLIPGVGELADVRDIYLTRARKYVIKKTVDDFREFVKHRSLEERVGEAHKLPAPEMYQRSILDMDKKRTWDYITKQMAKG